MVSGSDSDGRDGELPVEDSRSDPASENGVENGVMSFG
jgi:hypothetical protein